MSTPILPFLPDNADWIYQPNLSDEFNGPDLDPRWCPYYQASWGDLDASRARHRFITESDGTVSLELYVDNAGQGYWQPWRASNNTYKVAGITGGARDYMNMWPSGGFPITNHMPYYDAFAISILNGINRWTSTRWSSMPHRHNPLRRRISVLRFPPMVTATGPL